jgi:hypothetical protein
MATRSTETFPSLQLVPTRVHGIIDYVTGLLLIVAPFALGFNTGGAEQWVPIILGISALIYSLITRYELGVSPMIPMPLHLVLDAASGVLLAASPWLFGFADQIAWPHVTVGIFEVVMSVITQTKPGRLRRSA